MADMYYKGHWYGADDREEFLDLIRVGESNVSGNIWESAFYPPFTVAEAKEAYAMGLYRDRENGRIARHEINAYDAEYDAIVSEHMSEKERVRNRRRNDRKYKLTPKMRKEQEFMRKDHLYGYAWNLDCVKVRFAPDSEPIKTRKNAESVRIAKSDWKLEQQNHAEQMREIRRLDDMAEFMAECCENIDGWFMDSDIHDWTYAGGELAYGAEDRIEERRYYQAELDAYDAESRRLYADEEYYRAQVSFGIPARYYVRRYEK